MDKSVHLKTADLLVGSGIARPMLKHNLLTKIKLTVIFAFADGALDEQAGKLLEQALSEIVSRTK